MEWVVDSSLTLTVRFKGHSMYGGSAAGALSDLACSGQRHMHWEGWLALQEITFCHIVKWHMALWLKRRLDPGGMGVTATHKILYATPAVLAVAAWHYLTVFSPNIKWWVDLTKTTTTTKKTVALCKNCNNGRKESPLVLFSGKHNKVLEAVGLF